MVVRIEPIRAPLRGIVSVPYSKSISARQVILGVHRGGSFIVRGLSDARDTQDLVRVIQACGYEVSEIGEECRFRQAELRLPEALEVGEGGTTLRFLLPWLATLPGQTRLRVEGRLAERPLQPLLDCLVRAGAYICWTDKGLQVQGQPIWTPSGFNIDASQSGQFLSALFLMAPSLKVGTRIVETSGRPATTSYVQMTLELLAQQGYRWQAHSKGQWTLAAKPLTGHPWVLAGERDWSSAGYLWGWALMAPAHLELRLSAQSIQPEAAFWLRGPSPLQVKDRGSSLLLSSQGGALPSWEGAIHDVPDTFPTLAALAAYAQGTWTIHGIGTLPYKESHRLAAMAQELSKIGVQVTWSGGTCRIDPTNLPLTRSLTFHSHGDHRLAMALSLLAAKAQAPIRIADAQTVSKSFPHYWEVLRRIGISITFEA